MALTPEEEEQILRMLRNEKRIVIDRILKSAEAFSNWLAQNFRRIWNKIKDSISGFFEWLRGIFA